MTARGALALTLGAFAYVCAWAFGSRPLYPVAVGLIVVVAIAWAWVHLADRPLRLHRATRMAEYVEGDDVEVTVEVEQERRLTPASVVLEERIDRLGPRVTPLERHRRRLAGSYVLPKLPRGRYSFPEARAVLEDPFGLERIEVALPAAGAVVVYPRLAELDGLFSEGGLGLHEGRRLLLRRPAGFDLHSVREYEEGESLRKVHWRSTAHRGQLMVKELQDSPRDEVAVFLDAQAAGVVGTPLDSSFDVQVRAAGSILQVHARRGRRALLVISSRVVESARVHSFEGDWRGALELLAAAEPTGERPAAALIGDEAGPAGQAQELTVVTALLAPPLVDRLLQKALARRRVSLVYVDPASFAAPANGATREPGLLRLQAAGVAVSVIRRGDDLAARLSSPELARAALG
jgi:uncharacterized protein (DUF58 family)